MNRTVPTIALIAACTIITLTLSCIPENSLEWSADGSTGLIRADGSLALVDGDTSALTLVEDANVQPHPALSPDGKTIAYCLQVRADDYSKALTLLPPGWQKTLKDHAEKLAGIIRRDGLDNGRLPFEALQQRLGLPRSDERSLNEHYTPWLARFFIETAEPALRKDLGADLVAEITDAELSYYRLMTAPSANPQDTTTLATSLLPLWMLKFSPDGRLLAYLADRFDVKETYAGGFDLHLASPNADPKTALVDSYVALGYDFTHDGRQIAYMKPDTEVTDNDNMVLGTLTRRDIFDDAGAVVAEPIAPGNQDAIAAHTCTGRTEQLAGIIFHPWITLQCARDGRVFFCTLKLNIPSNKIEEEQWSIFAYDSLTGTVTEVVPASLIDRIEGYVWMFELSPDSTKMLIPGEGSTLALYKLGTSADSAKIIISTDEKLDDDIPRLLPAWKTNETFTYVAGPKSRFLTADSETPAERPEIVLINTQGKLEKIISRTWPDNAMKPNQ